MDIEIIKAKPENAEEMVAIRLIASLTVYVNEEYDITEEDMIAQCGPEAIDKLQRGLTERRIKGWLAKDKKTGEIIGASTAKHKKDRVRLSTLHVLPEYHGKGVGRDLLAAMFKWAETKHKDTFCYVVKYNTPRYVWYKRLGFEKLEETEWKLKTGKVIPRIKMVKRIGN